MSNHPVWDVYDLYRTARLNVKYLQSQLNTLQRCNVWIEHALVVAASSNVAGLWIWDNPSGQCIWKGLTVLTAFLAALRPTMNVIKKISEKQTLLAGYLALEHDLSAIVSLIKHSGKYDEELRHRFFEAQVKKGVLAQKASPEKANRKLIERCQKEVLHELPEEFFFLPKD